MALDFLLVSKVMTRNGIEIKPRFRIMKSSDLMIRAGGFYAIWDEEMGRWSEDENDAIRLIDREVDIYAEKHHLEDARKLYLWDSETGSIDRWHHYVNDQMFDNFHPLNEKLVFSNSPVKKTDYASFSLSYPLEKGPTENFDKLIGTLYSDTEMEKLLWTIGAIVSGDSKRLQKFVVLYGPPKSGKSTAINIMELLFKGYYVAFDAKTLGSSSQSFAFEAFRSNPLIAIQHDGDLSRIEDNTRINSLVSHEKVLVNVKNKSQYTQKFSTFLIMATNKPVRITDSKSGIIRRLIDISPTTNTLPAKEYDACMEGITFELGAIASKCLDFYKKHKDIYNNYIPLNMFAASNDFYNFMLYNYLIFKKEDMVTMTAAWDKYNLYNEMAKVPYPLSQRLFKEELKTYFREFHERGTIDGERFRSLYVGFKTERFESDILETPPETMDAPDWLKFDKKESLLDEMLANCKAQLAKNDKPVSEWAKVSSTLSDICTTEVHYVKPPENHIVIDFDIPDESGNKSLEMNIKAASKFPKTYAELSKSGQGIHLHYIYTGDVKQLSSVYDDHIEVKVFTGGSSLRRKLSRCNDVPVSDICSGLPLRKEKKVVNFDGIKNEKMLRALVMKNLGKEIVGNTKPSIELMYSDMEKAYEAGFEYDISDLRPAIVQFAAMSTHNKDYCIKKVQSMKFMSASREEIEMYTPKKRVKLFAKDDYPIIFFDVEVFPNLNIVCWKVYSPDGKDREVYAMVNPSPEDIEKLLKYRLVGFNNRRYDNHIIAAILYGYSPEEVYGVSHNIIKNGKGFIGVAYGWSYTDIFDYSTKKQSLKKWEIELGHPHKELDLDWDKPVPKELWDKVVEYCRNDVLATEAVWKATQADFTAREMLADISNMTPNDTTNSLTQRLIFGTNKNPQSQFQYRFMGDTSDVAKRINEWTMFDSKGRPVFPGYSFVNGKSSYRNEEIGEGGYVYAEPGVYMNVALLDITSMHPSSIIAENLFGDEYTRVFKELKDARVAIKHKEFEHAKILLNGALTKYLNEEQADALAKSLKIPINSVYGLTSAKFDNAFRDIRNVDNIVAKRGELFMINLKHEVQLRGFVVAHIKTDSIKIPNATNDIIKFVMDYGKLYGYDFEHEATYSKMCLVNDAVYIAKYQDADMCKAFYGYVPGDNVKKGGRWTATGTQFQVPYVFKTMFSKEAILFEDKCETKSVTTEMYLDCNESLPDGEHNYIYVGKVGQFCPVVAGAGGGLLVRTQGDKYNAVTGSKGYRWLESDMVKSAELEDKIDISYYKTLVDEARDAISKFTDVSWFLTDEPIDFPPYDENDLPF